MTAATASRFAHFLYWVGPWAPRGRAPSRVQWRVLPSADSAGGIRTRLYVPHSGHIRGAWLISPGLHYDGPEDPRMHRLASILAGGGYVVLSPAVPDLIDLRLTARVTEDVCRAFDLLMQQPEVPRDAPVAVMSVSVGSLAALRLGSSPPYAGRIASVMCFGGYANPAVLLRWLLGDTAGPEEPPLHDPLNQATVYMTLLEHLPVPIRDAGALCAAWRTYIRQTWPRMELKLPGSRAHIAIAQSVATQVCSEDRELFLIGCGAVPGGPALCDAALARARESYAFLDPLEHVERLSAPVHLVHGAADRVVPFSELEALRSAIPGARSYPLRSYAHSATLSAREIASRLPNMAVDMWTLTRIIRTLL